METQRNASETATPDGSRQVGRRGLIAAAVALGAAAIARLATPGRAEAADGGALLLGSVNAATSDTVLNTTTTGTGLDVNAGSASFAIMPSTNKSDGRGVYAIAGGVGGWGVYGFGGSIGVRGDNTSSGGLGVSGVNTQNGTGIKGVSNTGGSYVADGNGSGPGVHGKTNSGTGVLGQSTSGYGTAGISTSNVGIYGSANTGAGVYGTSTSYVGVYGNSTGAATGVFGASTNGTGGYFQSTNNIGLEGVSMTPNVPAGYFVSTVAAGPTRRAAQFDGDVLINGSYTATGLKSAAVPHPDGTLRKLYSLESPESFFEDFGKAAVEKGVATVALDPDFAVLVQTGEYSVFLTPNGDCRGLYVNVMGPQGFEVRELQGGTSSLPFSYRVVAKRRDVVAPRLEKLERERVKAFALKQYAAPAAPTIPPEQAFPEPAGGRERSRHGVPPGGPPSQPQVSPGRR